MGEQLFLPSAVSVARPVHLPALVRDIIEKLPAQKIRFDTIVRWVHLVDHEIDVCAIDKAARRFEQGEPGALLYGCPCKGEDPDPGPHISTCPWSDPDYSEGFPF